MNDKSKRIKQILIQLAIKDELPLDMTQLDESIFDKVFEDNINEELGTYLSNDESEYETVIENLRKALATEPDSMLDNVEGVVVWDKIEWAFTVKEFCDLIGLK